MKEGPEKTYCIAENFFYQCIIFSSKCCQASWFLHTHACVRHTYSHWCINICSTLINVVLSFLKLLIERGYLLPTWVRKITFADILTECSSRHQGRSFHLFCVCVDDVVRLRVGPWRECKFFTLAERLIALQVEGAVWYNFFLSIFVYALILPIYSSTIWKFVIQGFSYFNSDRINMHVSNVLF